MYGSVMAQQIQKAAHHHTHIVYTETEKQTNRNRKLQGYNALVVDHRGRHDNTENLTYTEYGLALSSKITLSES